MYSDLERVTCNGYDGIKALVANPTEWMKC